MTSTKKFWKLTMRAVSCRACTLLQNTAAHLNETAKPCAYERRIPKDSLQECREPLGSPCACNSEKTPSLGDAKAFRDFLLRYWIDNDVEPVEGKPEKKSRTEPNPEENYVWSVLAKRYFWVFLRIFAYFLVFFSIFRYYPRFLEIFSIYQKTLAPPSNQPPELHQAILRKKTSYVQPAPTYNIIRFQVNLANASKGVLWLESFKCTEVDAM